jgi:chemotaxis signal transduction protein
MMLRDEYEHRAHTRTVLEERARRLAMRSRDAVLDRQIEVLYFRIGSERYAIETRFVVRVARISAPTPIPEVSKAFAGVGNLQGEIVALVDLAALLGGSGCANAEHAILLGEQRVEFGILANEVEYVGTIALDDSTERGSPGTGCVLSVLPDARIMLNGEGLLADPRLAIDVLATPHGSQEREK